MATAPRPLNPRPVPGVRAPMPSTTSPLADLLNFGERTFLFIATLFLSGTIIFLIVGNVESEATVSSPVARLSWYPIYLGIVMGLVWRIKPLLRNADRLLPLGLVLLLTAASVIWSYDPDLTLRRAIALWATSLFGVYLAMRGNLLETLKILAVAWFVIALVNLFYILLQPATGIDSTIHIGAWKGISVEKNQLGGQMARANILFLAIIMLSGRWKGFWTAGFIVTAALVLGSTSKTALLAMVAPWGMAFVWWLASRNPRIALLTVYASAVVAGGMLAVLILAPDTVAHLIGKDLTLTGRTQIWDAALHSIDQRPWTGYGQGAFWQDKLGPSYDIRQAVNWEVPSAHNSWIEIGLSLGYPGMFAVMFLTAMGLILGSFRLVRRGDPWPLIFLIQLIFFSMSESILWQQNTFVSAWFVFLIAYLFMRRDPPKARQQQTRALPVYRR